MSARTSPSLLLWRDRLIILGGLAALTALSWLYVADMARGMGGMHSAPHAHAWGVSDFLFVFGMWSIMMIGMMLPSASPMVLTFSALIRRRDAARPFARTVLFVLGYLIVWVGYSAIVASAQGALQAAAVLSPMGASTTPYLGGSLLFAAGLFQFTPLKHVCLDRCRTPLGFLLAEWRPGYGGALNMGVRHGAYCAGCCWAIMALMFVLGTMNLLWMAVLAAFMLVEKVAPAGHQVGRGAGLLLVGWGLWVLAGAL